jgi:urease accessory protein
VSQGGQIASTRELLQPLAADAAVGVSDLEGLLTVRYLGHSAEQCRRIFTAVWRHWRPALCGVEAVVPRIWNT